MPCSFPSGAQETKDVLRNRFDKIDRLLKVLQIPIDGQPTITRFIAHFPDDLSLPHTPLRREDQALTFKNTPEVIDEFISSKDFIWGDLPTGICTHGALIR